MSWLARLKLQNASRSDASKPRQLSQVELEPGFPGFLAYPSVSSEKFESQEGAAIEPQDKESESPDRWCWPHTVAMNRKEIDTFNARVIRFSDKGAEAGKAESLADRLVTRDRDYDDRRLCLECAHLQGHGRWSCGVWKKADVARDALAPELVLGLHRCGGFSLHGQAQDF